MLTSSSNPPDFIVADLFLKCNTYRTDKKRGETSQKQNIIVIYDLVEFVQVYKLSKRTFHNYKSILKNSKWSHCSVL